MGRPGPQRARWDGRLKYLVERKWKAGSTAETIADELCVGLRQVKATVTALREQHGPLAGGHGVHVTQRRLHTVKEALTSSVLSRRACRPKPHTAATLNARVRAKQEFATTGIRTTRRDVACSGSRGVLRGTSIACRREMREGATPGRVEALVAEAQQRVPRARWRAGGEL
jgi:ribosomal protein S14